MCEQETMSGIKLLYFDLRGRGEASRLVLAAAGQKFDDVRFTFDQWPTEKPNTPFGQLPVLEYKGKKYGQSRAIASFLAREFGLFGKDNLQGLRIDEVLGLADDLMQCMVKSRFGPDETVKAEASKKLVSEDIPKFMGFFEALLKQNGDRGFFVGNTMSLADLVVFDITDTLLKVNGEVLVPFPNIQKLRSNVSQHHNIKTYLAARKDSDF